MSAAPCYAGIDVGSATAKAVLFGRDGSMLAHAIIPSGGQLSLSAELVLTKALEKAGLARDAVQTVVATGYGRDTVTWRTKSITEITCHARGAYFLSPHVRSVIDIGGQDSKAISLAQDGSVRKFEMNDKCAAGTGRFLEVMARTLGLSLEDFGPKALIADTPAKISSTCTVFAESEVISLLAQGETVERILAGLCAAITQRVHSLASRVGMAPEVMMTGGVAKNIGVVKRIEQAIGFTLTIPEEPQIIGALGAALYAKDMG
ncbi:MAG TPA: acyl-CoA dehydratase activase [Candidatus Hydrogenedentes bacterium]|nr:acyl-CoA dehydratase activase [Candidatus Hydrogenedentota bacterium]